MVLEEIFNKKVKFLRSTPLEPYYRQCPTMIDGKIINLIEATEKLLELREKFKEDVLDRAEKFRLQKPAFSFPKRKMKFKAHKHHHGSEMRILNRLNECGLSCSSDSDISSIENDSDEDSPSTSLKELERKKSHPSRLHPELWYNEPGEMNDGLLCRCSLKAQRSGIRHGIYLGEEHLPRCDPNTNNLDRLYHYLVTIEPKTNFIIDCPTTIEHDGHRYYFEGYSFFSHFPIPSTFPHCKIIRYNIEYTISFERTEIPQNFCIGDLDFVFDYIIYELLELVDFNLKAKNDNDGCKRFHFMPRFVRLLEGDGKELLSISLLMQYLLQQSNILIPESELNRYLKMNTNEWNDFAKQFKGFLVTSPSMKPCTLRVDQIDREIDKSEEVSQNLRQEKFPVIVHFGVRPPQLSYAGNPKYQKAWRDYVKYRHLLANKEKVTYQDKEILAEKEEKLQEMRFKTDMKRDVTVVVSSEGFYRTGLQCDIVQHSLIIPVLVSHLRFQYSLQHLENIIDYTFKDRSLLQLSLTHPSYRENFGTNPDHARNTLTNCGLRYLEYGDRKVHFMNTRKRGINMLINIMSRFGCNEETVSNINHNERLEFLGDAVVEFLTSIHLYFLFSDLEEGGLATYRAALVQNQHLAVLAKRLQLEKFMLYAHGSDLCHDLELRHAMANCFEALIGSLFLDGGIEIADRVFSATLFDPKDSSTSQLNEIWVNYPLHPLQAQYPDGDRHLIKKIPRLQELVKFEEMVGIEFKHIRLLARAFTHRSLGFNNLTLGSNQRMEFLGDTVLQLIASEYLYKYFPQHHEGHLSLLRSSLVNNKTQSVVCDDLGLIDITHYNSVKSELKTKDRADLLEAFIGAIYVDKGIEFCRVFTDVCFFPRLEQFILNQDWNDPKSKLQQCCLTLRSVDCGEPDIPTYKVIESKGPTNTRIYEVAVYFRDDRLATGKGHSIQEAEMNAATNALIQSKGYSDELFLL
ncbi:ribonuclease 3-like protein [Sarcoptes scabiei]|uniref:Ribonuclease 3 n=1 Tax=Sarcoptes scabiei TaxID=52283 RepID=A0A131ZTL2_SARSC|nr:ribonuclease 3-like protein [Sarcoptes scabiei]